jgi:hypothetical protein
VIKKRRLLGSLLFHFNIRVFGVYSFLRPKTLFADAPIRTAPASSSRYQPLLFPAVPAGPADADALAAHGVGA